MEVTHETVKGVKISTSSPDQSWRLVHDGKKVIAKMQRSGETGTRNTLFLAATEEEVDEEIARLKLTPLEPNPERIVQANLDEVPRRRAKSVRLSPKRKK